MGGVGSVCGVMKLSWFFLFGLGSCWYVTSKVNRYARGASLVREVLVGT